MDENGRTLTRTAAAREELALSRARLGRTIGGLVRQLTGRALMAVPVTTLLSSGARVAARRASLLARAHPVSAAALVLVGLAIVATSVSRGARRRADR